MSEKMISIELHQRSDYQFDIQFGAAVPDLLCDEPAPLGQGLGPSPVQLLAAAVGNCLSDSFLFACRKYKQSPEPLRTVVTAVVGTAAVVTVDGMDQADTEVLIKAPGGAGAVMPVVVIGDGTAGVTLGRGTVL